MKLINEFEEIIRSKKWPDKSVVYGPVLNAYISSKERKLSLINFDANNFWNDEDVKLSCDSLQKFGIDEILISSSTSSTLETIGKFNDYGYCPVGCARISNPGGVYDPQTAIVLRYQK